MKIKRVDIKKESVILLNMENMQLKKLKYYMKKRGLTQRELSAISGINEYTLSRWLTGRNKPSPLYEQIIEKLVRKFEL